MNEIVFPIALEWATGSNAGVVVEFSSPKVGKVIVGNSSFPIGYENDNWWECANSEWKPYQTTDPMLLAIERFKPWRQ